MPSPALAARCPACRTVFRVVPDQLRVSEGWVRCGHCSEIFNAAASLVDVQTGAPRPASDALAALEAAVEGAPALAAPWAAALQPAATAMTQQPPPPPAQTEVDLGLAGWADEAPAPELPPSSGPSLHDLAPRADAQAEPAAPDAADRSAEFQPTSFETMATDSTGQAAAPAADRAIEDGLSAAPADTSAQAWPAAPADALPDTPVPAALDEPCEWTLDVAPVAPEQAADEARAQDDSERQPAWRTEPGADSPQAATALADPTAVATNADAAPDAIEATQPAAAAELAVAQGAEAVEGPAAEELDATAAESAAALAPPSFMRQAQRAERWRQPRVRAGLAALGLIAAVALVAQITVAYRDLAAARFPAARPLLEATCGLLGCRVGAARAINSLSVESSGLVRVEQTHIYSLQLALRNRAGIELALPAMELSLSDAQGRLLARRVLQAAELGVSQVTLAAGADLALQATLEAAPPAFPEPIAGYTIEIFYP